MKRTEREQEADDALDGDFLSSVMGPPPDAPFVIAVLTWLSLLATLPAGFAEGASCLCEGGGQLSVADPAAGPNVRRCFERSSRRSACGSCAAESGCSRGRVILVPVPE